MSKNDPVVSFIGGMAHAAVAPVLAAVEVATDGKVSSDTAGALIRGTIGDCISDSVGSALKK